MSNNRKKKKECEESSSETSVSSAYYECDSWVKGPPFQPKDYMISPTDSETPTTHESIESFKKKLLPVDLKFESDVLDARNALKKLIKLIRDKLARNFVHRQKNLVCAFVKGMTSGFLLEDIASVTELIEYFMLNYESVPEYIDMINLLLKVAMTPPRISKSSEILNFKRELSAYFTVLGELLTVFDSTDFQLRVLEILNYLLVRSEPVEMTCVKLAFCYSAMEESLLPYILACLLETVPVELYNNYLNVCLEIALASRKACITMCRNGAMEYILCRLNLYSGFWEKNCFRVEDGEIGEESIAEKRKNEYYNMLDKIGHLMWIFLNNITEADKCKSPSLDALRSLRTAFHFEAEKNNEKSISVRDNLACIVLKLQIIFGDSLPLVQSGLAVDIAMLAVCLDDGDRNQWMKKIIMGTSEEDFYLKQLMLFGCCALAKDYNMAEILREQKVMEGVLRLIDLNLIKGSYPWSSSQFLYSCRIAFLVVTELVSLLPDVYITYEGNARILQIIEWLLEENFDKTTLLLALKTLCASISCENNSAIIDDLKKLRAPKILLKLCSYLLETQNLRKERQEKLIKVFFILEKLCANEKKIPTCYGSLYVTASIQFLNRAVKNQEEDSKFEPRLLMIFSSFLWEAVVWCRTLLKSFAEKNGIYLLLDLMQMASYPVQVLMLGLLVDIADDGETITHLLTWRDKDGYGILNTMIKIWKKEELIHKVPRTKNGCIADIERVLMSEEQWYLTHCCHDAHIYSPAIAEMITSARPKVHSLYRILRERYGELTRLNESLYSVSFGAVQPQNQVYIPLIEYFYSLKLGEVWFETFNKVILNGLVPTHRDGETLRKLVERKNDLAYRLKTIQEDIIDLQKENSIADEKKLYQLIRSCCMTSALDALHELDFIARTTYKDVEVKKKAIQIENIEGSLILPFGIDDNHIHRTTLRDTNVTYLCGKYVWFKSEKEVLPENILVNPISPDSSSCKNMQL